MSTFRGREEEDFIHNDAHREGSADIFSEMANPLAGGLKERAEEQEDEEAVEENSD